MAKQKLTYQEGTWFAIPLRTNGFALGVVGRLAGDGRVFGYFFGPKTEFVSQLRPEKNVFTDAVWVGRFGDLGLLSGEWPIVGESSEWDRVDWPLPPFVRVDDVSGKAVKATYTDELQFVGEADCDIADAETFPRDALSGYGAVEKRLTALLDTRP